MAVGRRIRVLALLLICVSVSAIAARARSEEPKPAEGVQQVVHRVTGLFSPDREADLRKALEKIDGVKLVSIDFDYSEATFEYDVAVAFAGTKPEQVVERFNEWLRNNSSHTLGIKPRCTVPREKLTRIEIGVGLLDCKACCLAVYEILAQQDGVEQAAVSSNDAKAAVLIDPSKTDKAKLEAALREREVAVLP